MLRISGTSHWLRQFQCVRTWSAPSGHAMNELRNALHFWFLKNRKAIFKTLAFNGIHGTDA